MKAFRAGMNIREYNRRVESVRTMGMNDGVGRVAKKDKTMEIDIKARLGFS